MKNLNYYIKIIYLLIPSNKYGFFIKPFSKILFAYTN